MRKYKDMNIIYLFTISICSVYMYMYVGNHFLKLLANLASTYWNLFAKIKFH